MNRQIFKKGVIVALFVSMFGFYNYINYFETEAVTTNSTSPNRVSGKFGMALEFDGINDFVDISSVKTDLISESGTIALWVKGSGYMFSGSNPDNYRDYFEFNTSVISLRPSNTYKWHFYLEPVITQDKWHYVVLTQDGSEPALYVDGIKKNIQLTDPLFPSSIDKSYWFDKYNVSRVDIGAFRSSGNSNQYFKGLIDDMKIYNRSLNADEVMAGYSGSDVDASGLVGWWKFDEISGNTVLDSSGKNHSGTLGNIITSISNISDSVCGNNVCEDGESPRGCVADCSSFKEVIDTQECTTWHAPNVFNYYPCGNTKIYEVIPEKNLRFAAYGDGCASCVCYSLDFDMYDYINGQWSKIKSVNDGSVKSSKNVFDYIPQGNKVKVVGTSGCFHFNLYQESSGVYINSDENISPIKSTIKASPEFVPADGVLSSTITVAVKKENGLPMANRNVKILSNRNDFGIDDKKTVYTGVTNINGIAKFVVKSTFAQTSSYTAIVDWDSESSVTLNSKANVSYITLDKCDKENFALSCNGSTATATPNRSPYINRRDENNAIDNDLETIWAGSWDTNEATVFTVTMPNKVDINKVKINLNSTSDLPYRPSNSSVSIDAIYLPTELKIQFKNNDLWITKYVDTNITEKGWKEYDISGQTNAVRFIMPDTWAWNKYVMIREIGIYGSGTTSTINTNNYIANKENCLPDDTLIKMPDDSKIYVIDNCQKRWIESGEEFQQNGYNWSDVKDASPEIVNAYNNYLKAQSKLLKAVGQNRIYRIFNGKDIWVPSVSAFNAQGLKWDEVENTSDNVIDQYNKVKLIKTKGDDRIFYVTNFGMKKHIITTEVFNAYDNRYEDVVEVSEKVANSFETVNLIKDFNGHKVYKIEGNQKRWIKSAKAFNRNKFDWNKIASVNDTELEAFEDAEVIE